MKIKIADFWLAEAGELAPDELIVNARRIVQVAQFLRSSAAKPIPRKNTITTISFSVTRTHTSVRAAGGYMLQHEVDIPDEGVITFISQDQGGGESNYYFDNAAVETTQAKRIGVTTFHSYTIIGGRITTVKPT